jgi:hypothetical protein
LLQSGQPRTLSRTLSAAPFVLNNRISYQGYSAQYTTKPERAFTESVFSTPTARHSDADSRRQRNRSGNGGIRPEGSGDPPLITLGLKRFPQRMTCRPLRTTGMTYGPRFAPQNDENPGA